MAKYKHECKNCGNEFYNYFEKGSFCSRECYRNFYKENGKTKIKKCSICGEDFRPSYADQIFCSVECRVKSTENKIECICESCGKLFLRIQSEVDKNKRHYCSVQCRNDGLWWSEEDTDTLRENFGKITYKEMTNIFSVPKTVDMIKRRAIYIGLTSSQEWSADEIKILVDNYSSKPMNDVMMLLPSRSQMSILGQAKAQGIKSFFYLNHVYSKEDDEYLAANYLMKTNDELGEYLGRSSSGIAQHLWVLGLHRPTIIDSYNDLVDYLRSRLYSWKERVRKSCDYMCELTKSRSNIIVHHIRSFNLLMSETIDVLNFPIYEHISEYTHEQLDLFLQTFLQIQESYHSYICITEEIHKRFHHIYGYGNNTQEQWDELVNKYYKN